MVDDRCKFLLPSAPPIQERIAREYCESRRLSLRVTNHIQNSYSNVIIVTNHIQKSYSNVTFTVYIHLLRACNIGREDPPLGNDRRQKSTTAKITFIRIETRNRYETIKININASERSKVCKAWVRNNGNCERVCVCTYISFFALKSCHSLFSLG